MAANFDFQIIAYTDVPGISLVVAQNEDAFVYATETEDMACLQDGSMPLASDKVGDFMSDCGWDNFSCTLV